MGKLLDIIADLGTRYLGVLCSATFADHAGDESSWKIRARVQHSYLRLHGGNWTLTEAITHTIDKLIHNRISSLRYARDHRLEVLMRRWFELSVE
ncbi:hypothetical protein HID58_020700 [Brassica napus]|uniref:Uncharacterized protein n=1 Tax=Brassica napus TaxID=3708 RepID=A0ABQ8CUA7_BRANA|nr:hypothetical protein HID58_020700 [Brassica napus]